MKIGNITTPNNVFLAPMAGVTDMAYRKICKKYGAGMLYSEMVSAKGLHYSDRKTHELMDIDESEHPCAIQIFGSEPEIMAEVVPYVIAAGADVIDINMGCPMPKIVNNGDGSALMKNPEMAGKVIRAVSDVSSVPVSVKIRSGWDDNSINAVEIAKILEANGAAAIAVHGRTREMFYRGSADWSIIGEVKRAVKIPVIGNGDIFTPQDAVKMMDQTGCDAVMVGRGAQGNPFIFKQINELIEFGEVKTFPTNAQRVTQALEHLNMLVEYKGEDRGVKEARKHIAWYIKGMKDSAKIKAGVFALSKIDKIQTLLTEYINQIQN